MIGYDSPTPHQGLNHHKQLCTLFDCLAPHVSIIIINIIYISVHALKLY